MLFSSKPDVYAPKFEGFKSPWGNFQNSGGYNVFNPKQSNVQKRTEKRTDNRILKTINQLPNKFSPEDYFNNPFYSSTLNMMLRPIQEQQQQDQRSLMNQLNARNQIGGSYDALQNNLLSRRYDTMFRGVEDQARQASAGAYQQQFSNLLAQLGSLRQDRGAALNAAMAPLPFGLQSQQLLNQQQLGAGNLQLQNDRNNLLALAALSGNPSAAFMGGA